MGDPAGIGPEITVKAIVSPEIQDVCRPMIIGDARVARKALREENINLPICVVTSLREAGWNAAEIRILDTQNADPEKIAVGQPSPVGGRAVFEDVQRAVQLAQGKQVSGIVAGPHNKYSVNLAGVSVQEAVQRIASGSDTMFFYAEGAPGSEKISMVRIFPRGNEPVQPGIVYLGTGAVTKTGDATDSPEHALKVLGESASVEEREKAIEILAAGKNEAAIPVLAKAVSDPAPEIRIAALDALSTMQSRAALPAVLQALKDAHPGVRQSAASAVGVLGSARNLRQLRPLTADKDAGVAAAAELAVRRLSSAADK